MPPFSEPRAYRPPHNIEAEQAIVGAAMVTNSMLAACEWLTPEDFYEPVHGRIWKGLRRRHESGEKADPVMLREAFERDPALAALGGAGYLAELARAATSIVTATDYAKEVVRLARKRRLADAFLAGLSRVENEPDASAAEILSGVQPDIEAATVDASRRQGRTLPEIARLLGEQMQSPPELFSTGIEALDAGMGGGESVVMPDGTTAAIPFGYVIGLEARPGDFKTGCLTTIALNVAWAGHEITYIAMEMGSLRLGQRMLARAGEFRRGVFRHRDDKAFNLLVRATSKSPTTLLVEDCQGASIGQVKQVVAEGRIRRGCRIFMLDYLQRVRPDGPVESQQQHLEQLSYWIADEAERRKETWFVASQENRNGETLGGDGLLRASDFIGRIRKHEAKRWVGDFGECEVLHIDARKARDDVAEHLGSADEPRFMIHPHGPHLAELPR